MQVAIKTDLSVKPKVFELSREKYKFFMQFVTFLADDIVDEKSDDYKKFFEGEVNKAMKTKRIKSGNSLREII